MAILEVAMMVAMTEYEMVDCLDSEMAVPMAAY